MRIRCWPCVALALFGMALLAGLPSLAAARPAAQLGSASRRSEVPRLYVATGPASDADLGWLRASVGALAGITRVEARREFGSVTVTVDSDGRSTESLIAAAARAAGFTMRPARPRFYAATRSGDGGDPPHLRAALRAVPGVDEVAVSEQVDRVAVRVLGVTPLRHLAQAGRNAGFELHPLGAYVAAGPHGEADLARLRAALGKVNGVQRVEVQGLAGGATLLVHGEASDPELVAAAKAPGFDLWPLNNGPAPRVFRIEPRPGTIDPEKLREALQGLEGVGSIEIRPGPAAEQQLVVTGRVRPDAILAAATEAGFTLTPAEAPVALPTLTPQAQRAGPPDYDQRVLEERARIGEPAPGFTVLGMDGMTRRSLAEYLGPKKPVVLVFGSCT